MALPAFGVDGDEVRGLTRQDLGFGIKVSGDVRSPFDKSALAVGIHVLFSQTYPPKPSSLDPNGP